MPTDQHFDVRRVASTRPRADPAGDRQDGRRARTTVVLLVLAAVALISLDLTGRGSGMRTVVGSVVGPVETGASRAAAPFGAIPELFNTRSSLRRQNDRLEARNAALRRQIATTGLDRGRLAEYDALSRYTTAAGLRTVQAHVVGVGAAQTFRRTVTIDVGESRGVHRDMTVIAPDGLVGRVLSATRDNATVLLAIDKASVVGARLGSDNELGLLRGDGSLAGAGRLSLTTTDPSKVPTKGDTVVSWGSRNGVPYVAGVPIGRVESVTAAPRAQTATVAVAPFVDFSSLDLVAVVVAAKG